MEEVKKEILSKMGCGTSLVSLIIPDLKNISMLLDLLQEELKAASNIKSKGNREDVCRGILMTYTKLKEFANDDNELRKEFIKKGLYLWCGTLIDGSHYSRCLIKPSEEISGTLYICDNKFYI